MKKSRKLKVILFRIFVLFLIVFAVIFIPILSLKNDNDLLIMYGTFVGKQSDYKGIVEIWNIDTFDAVSVSKSHLLKDSATLFCSQNKGVNFLVRNITEQECLNLLESGEVPDLFSCSYGVSKKIKDHIREFSSIPKTLDKTFADAGTDGEKFYALAWCYEMYMLISTKQNLTNAGLDENSKLIDVFVDAGYTKKVGKKEKIIYPLLTSNGSYTLPLKAISSYNGIEVKSNLKFEYLESEKCTAYSAYCKFISGKGTILLGTNRDYFLMENRKKQGKISDCIYEVLPSYTDLVQFVFLGKTGNANRQKTSEDFANFLLSNTIQEKLIKTGMNGTTGLNFSAMQDIALDFDGVLSVPNVFS